MKSFIKLVVTVVISIQLGMSLVGSAQESVKDAAQQRLESMDSMINSK
jgi:hypothetical protein